MNLWVRTILRQLTVLAVALFFFSCEDESSILGFKNPNKKFKVNYVDIPLASDVFLLDSLRTSNFNQPQGETNRLLVGEYTDDQFGTVRAAAFTQFFTANSAKTLLKETAAFDSVSIQLRFDLYTYGSLSTAPQTISIHEVEKELMIDSLGYYFNKSNTPYDPTPLGTKTFAYAPDHFRDYLTDNLDTTITVHMPLDHSFGQRIFDSALKYRNANTAADSTFVRIREFVKEFKGIAIVPDNADKIFGFNPSASATRITLHYHDAENDSLQLNLNFSGVVGYNAIDADYSGTALAGLTQFSKPIAPDNNLRHIQSGTGVLTRLDFSKFYEFADADSNATMIVNSAELHLGAPEPSSVYDPINAFSLRAIKNEGYLKRLPNKNLNPAQYLADSLSIGLYAGQLTLAGNTFSPAAHDGNVFLITKDGSNDYYNGFFTLFAQQLFKRDQNKERFRYFALYPETPQPGKAVNRIVFQEQNIMLRVFYTRPNDLTP